jgi:hypothetical protein
MLHLAVATTSLRKLKIFQFKDCHFLEFSHFCVAVKTGCQRRQVTFRFDHCGFNVGAAQALQLMLESNALLEELSFTDCYFDDDQAASAIEVGLSKNRSLRKFQFIYEK